MVYGCGMEIGKNIYRLRKDRRLTQEQLAKALGVSTPAVSKWETGGTCPDITLLAPLARILKTSIDELLSYSSNLSKGELEEIETEIREYCQEFGYRKGMEKLQEYLLEYPNSDELKMFAVTSCLMLIYTLDSDYTEEEFVQFRNGMKKYADEVAQSKDTELSQAARIYQVTQLMSEERLDEALELLNSFPVMQVDVGQMKGSIYLMKEEFEEAEKLWQADLLKNILAVSVCVHGLSNVFYRKKEIKKAIFYEEVCGQLGEIFDSPSFFNTEERMACLYLEDNEEAKALEYILKYVDRLTKLDYNLEENPFFNTVKLSGEQKTGQLKGVKQMLLNSLQSDEKYVIFKDRAEFNEAIKKLEEHISKL